MKYLVILTILAISVCESYKILVLLPYPGKSHHMVFEPVLEELVHRGHHLTVVSFFPLTTPHENRRDISLVGLLPLNLEVVDLKAFEDNDSLVQNFLTQFSLIYGLSKDSIQLCETLMNAKIFEEFVKAEGDYDVILLEHFNSNCMLGIVHNYDVPSIGLISCTMMPWTASWVGADDNSAIVPNMMLPFTNEMTFIQRLINSFYLVFYKWWHHYVSSCEQTILETRLGRRLPPLDEIGRNASVVLVNTHYTLNGVRVLPPSVIEVGGIHLRNRTVKPLPEDLERWVTQSEHGVVLVSFGSLIRGSTLPPKRLNAMLKVFARFPQRFVWKWESENLTVMPENVRVMQWIPQYDLLHHPKCAAFITHGGLLSLTEIVASGVPALIVPVLGDQPGNAAHAKQAGVAEVLAFHQINEQNLYEALTKILSPEIKARTKAFSRLWWDRPLPPMDTAVYYIEKTARYGNLNMSSPARHMSEPHLVFYKSIAYTFFLPFFIILLVISLLGLLLVVSICCCSKKVKVKQS